MVFRILTIFMMLLVGSVASASLTDLSKAPPNFSYFGDSYVFVDIEKIRYEITYDITNRKAFATSHLYFKTTERGRPIFDLKPNVNEVIIDGDYVNAVEVPFPGNESWAKSIDSDLSPGDHHMVIKNQFRKNVSFSSGSVRSAFWLSDLEDRSFIEEYLPTNLEYDQMTIEIDLGFLGNQVNHTVYTNSERSEENNGRTTHYYPSHFTASSLFFHLGPEGSFREKKGSYRSIDGRDIPVVAYGKWPISVNRFYNNSLTTLR